VAKFDPLVVVDYYKAYRLKGEEIYTHFYINDTTGRLVVNSFKEI
jgi:N-acetyl-gamma-glutamylphosphate reductase